VCAGPPRSERCGLGRGNLMKFDENEATLGGKGVSGEEEQFCPFVMF
jgi:hypothetical protein